MKKFRLFDKAEQVVNQQGMLANYKAPRKYHRLKHTIMSLQRELSSTLSRIEAFSKNRTMDSRGPGSRDGKAG
jgi:hypothetical protein